MEETIFSLEQGAMERWRSGDPWGWLEISAEDVIYIDPGLVKPVVGLTEYGAYLKSIEGRVRYQGSQFIEPRMVVLGDAALLTYNYQSRAELPDGRELVTPWNTTEVYFRRDNHWQIVHTHWSHVHHRPPERVDVPVPAQPEPGVYQGELGELMALESQAMRRWRSGDPWGFIEISAPEVTYFDSGTPRRINGREALRAEYAAREGKIFYAVMDFVDPAARVCGDMAVLVYRFLSTWLNPDGSVARRTPWNCSEVFARLDSGWQIIHTHWSHIHGQQA